MVVDKSSPGKGSPWLTIPADDYEAHMASPSVAQLGFLNQLFADILLETRPTSVAVLGCTTGNGFEHIVPATTSCAVGIDINTDYLRIAKSRLGARLPPLMLAAADVEALPLRAAAFDLVHCALLFEYVDPARVLSAISLALKPNGILTVVLQLPSEGGETVSPSPYTSLRRLVPIMRLVPPQSFAALATASGLSLGHEYTRTLPTGKAFWAARFGQVSDRWSHVRQARSLGAKSAPST